LQGSQLVAEGKTLKDHVVVATAGHVDRTQEQQRQFKHVLILPGVPAESNTGSAMTTFWRTTATRGARFLRGMRHASFGFTTGSLFGGRCQASCACFAHLTYALVHSRVRRACFVMDTKGFDLPSSELTGRVARSVILRWTNARMVRTRFATVR
jgi:hypothetical protein